MQILRQVAAELASGERGEGEATDPLSSRAAKGPSRAPPPAADRQEEGHERYANPGQQAQVSTPHRTFAKLARFEADNPGIWLQAPRKVIWPDALPLSFVVSA